MRREQAEIRATANDDVVDVVRYAIRTGRLYIRDEDMDAMKNRPRVGSAVPAQQEDARPRCRKHRKFMVYNPAEDIMECKELNCKQKARRQHTFRNAVGADVGQSPGVYRGEIQFVIDQTGELYMYLVDANAMVSLMGIQAAEVFENDMNANSQQNQFLTYVAHLLPTAEQAHATLTRRMRQELATQEAEKRFQNRQVRRKDVRDKDSW